MDRGKSVEFFFNTVMDSSSNISSEFIIAAAFLIRP
jgi:hypothetical protein